MLGCSGEDVLGWCVRGEGEDWGRMEAGDAKDGRGKSPSTALQ